MVWSWPCPGCSPGSRPKHPVGQTQALKTWGPLDAQAGSGLQEGWAQHSQAGMKLAQMQGWDGNARLGRRAILPGPAVCPWCVLGPLCASVARSCSLNLHMQVKRQGFS